MAFGLVTVVVTHGTRVQAADLWLHRWLQSHRSAGLTSVALDITSTGSSTLLIPMVLAATWAIGRGTARARFARSVLAAATMALGVGARLVISELVARPRPPQADWAGPAHGYAFPSGHTAAAAMTAGLLIWHVTATSAGGTRRTVVTLSITWALAVGFTRAYLGVHWPTDVLGSWLFAIAWLCTAGGVVSAWRR